jgi:hypothetical protein
LELWWQWWLLAGLAAIAVIFTRRARDPVEMILLGLTFWQSLAHQRHIPFFALLFAFWLPQHLDSVWRRWQGAASEEPLGQGWSAPARWAAATCMALCALLIGRQLAEQTRRIPVHRDGYPVSAIQFMADHGLEGRLVVHFKWAQYAIAAFGSPQPDRGIRVAFDGRFRTCYPQEVVDMYFDFATGEDSRRQRFRSPESPPLDPTRILDYGRPDLVLIDRGQTLPLHVMLSRQQQWTLLYRDDIAQLWGRAEKYDDPASPHFISPAQRHLDPLKQTGVVAWPALPATKAASAKVRDRLAAERTKHTDKTSS